MKQEKNTVQFSEIRSKGCNDIEMLERFLHGIVETATSKLRQRKLKTTEISIRLVHAKSENRLPLEFTFSIKPTSSSVIIYTEVINRFKECYTGGGIQGFTKMQKWMGFFLSEHASALSDDTNKVTYMSDLSLEKKLLLLSQVYAGQLRTRIQVIEKNKRVSYTGTIPSLTKDFILIKTTTGHINLKLKDIISIELVEEVLYESA